MTHVLRAATRSLVAIAVAAPLCIAFARAQEPAPTRVLAAARQSFRGSVLLPNGAPATHAIVVTSAGGQFAVRGDGSFEIEVDVPGGVSSVRITAIATSGTSSLVASVSVEPSSPHAILLEPLVLGPTTSCQPTWLPTFGPQPGIDGIANALAVFDDGSGPALYVAGSFTSINGVVARNIAKWNGAHWSAVGGGVAYQLWTLAVFDEGGGPALFAAGDSSFGVATAHISKWDGTSWSTLGTGMTGSLISPNGYTRIDTLAVIDLGTGPALYATGNFTSASGTPARGIAKWDGANWSALGSGLQYSAATLAGFDDGGGPALYAGGAFTTAGGVAASYIAKWNGASWSALSSQVNAPVTALAAFDDGSGPALYAAGGFTMAGAIAASKIAKWNGATWSALGSGITGQAGFPVEALAVFDDGSGAMLYACGTFTTAGGQPAQGIAKWNGSTWSTPAAIAGGYFYRMLTVFDDGSGPALCFAGRWDVNYSSVLVTTWNGVAWSVLKGPTLGMNGSVSAVTVFDDGSGPALYAGGSFTIAGGGVQASGIAKWDGSGWSPLGSGIAGAYAGVSALAVFDDGSGAALYAGGDFSSAGGTAAANIAKWDGASWSSLGSGLEMATSTPAVTCLAVFDDGGGPELHAGGGFSTAGGVAARLIAKWDGSTWSPLSTGITSIVAPESVDTMAVFDDGTGPSLYVGGVFTAAGGVPARNIARWDGVAWSAMGAGLGPGVVSALAVFDDGSGPALYAGGNFTRSGTTPATRIAKWNGAWSALGQFDDRILALTVFDDGGGAALYAGGSFTMVSAAAADRIAKWNGSAWSGLAAGMNGPVRALTGFDDGSGAALHAGGSFTMSTSGDSYLAKWGCTLPAGARTYGASSPGCNGPLAVGATSPVQVGNASFALTCTNAPPSAPGALLLGSALPAQLVVLATGIWVNPILAPGIASDPTGKALVPLAIPGSAALAGLSFAAQFVWVGPTIPPPCPPFGLSASNGIVLTIQP